MWSRADPMNWRMDLSHIASGASVHRGRHSSLPVLGGSDTSPHSPLFFWVHHDPAGQTAKI